MNIVVVARRKKLLDDFSFELERKYQIQTKVLIIGLSEQNSAEIIKTATTYTRNGAAGRPALLYRLPLGLSAQA